MRTPQLNRHYIDARRRAGSEIVREVNHLATVYCCIMTLFAVFGLLILFLVFMLGRSI